MQVFRLTTVTSKNFKQKWKFANKTSLRTEKRVLIENQSYLTSVVVFIVGRSNQQVVLIAEIDFNKTFSPPFLWLTFACTSPVVAPVASTSSATLPWSPHPSIVTSPLILWPHTWSTLTPVTCKNNHNLTLALETKKVILSKHVCQGVNAKEFYVQLSKEGRQNPFTFKLRFGTARIERNLRTTC